MDADTLHTALAQEWIATASADVARRPETIGRHFASAGRRAGRTPLAEVPGWRTDEAARALLLAALPPEGRAERLATLYAEGTADEKLAVLKALPLLQAGPESVPLLRDAIRTNDPRLVLAALGPCARHLDQAAWRHAVLKCVFIGAPLDGVHGLHERADAELTTMLAGLAEERTAAGRTMPADALALLGSLTQRKEA
ncbi:EboA domain-containing protein [Microbispora sp. RL4-1S]|uniref:EboA domain-containing protein n=1 Tax=Microbispora oryzae TaxID=2806554 RepID=A0A941ASI6_9ACTN|nr:EboA domain-containing protein [Microbispora oryzae]MBP2708434.1 EboA domain-containing protein [Microbispora oryzae]